ncbi:MAG: flagellar hook assembly protein FlgD [Deltaproteobacteria bacterium]
MEINGLNGANAASSLAGAPANQELGKDQFLQLLIAQLSNQNPLEPLEGADFVAQLATFSNLEQLTSINEGMDSLAVAQAGVLQGQTVDLVGRTAVFEGDQIDLESQGNTLINFELARPAVTNSVEIIDDRGRVVAKIRAPAETGLSSVEWDGTDTNGNRLPPGSYRYRLDTQSPDSDPVEATLYATKRIDGVTYEDGAAKLMADALRIDPANVVRVLN